jgi:hypothetical protein
MQFNFESEQADFQIDRLVIAGWTGRNMEAVQEHIDELAELGIAPPSTVPLFYQVGAQMLTTNPGIDVLSAGTSGEVEPLLVKRDGQFWLGLGSDHTDRDLEAFSVAHSKQVCPKTVSDSLWAWKEVEDHLDTIELRSWIDEGQGWTLYQEGTLASIRPLQELIDKANLADNSAMLCGTLPAIGGVRRTPKLKLQMHDPIKQRSIEFEYAAKELSVIK